MNQQISDRDIELGIDPEMSIAGIQPSRRWTWEGLSSSFNQALRSQFTIRKKEPLEKHQIEDYPKGYPQFAALMAADESLRVFRRFEKTRIRLLLLDQDRISRLETTLDKLDRDEASPMFLGVSREDGNQERQKVICELREALKDYDESMAKYLVVSTARAAHPQDAQSLLNWNLVNGCISRAEMEFLGQRQDLLCLATQRDGMVSWLERHFSGKLLFWIQCWRSDVSRDEHVHIFPRHRTDLLARLLLGPLIVALVLTPVIICSLVHTLAARLAIVIVATSIFLTTLSVLTRGKVLDLVVAGATYTTVLVVFITGPSAN